MVRHVRLDIQLQPGGEKAFSFNILQCTIYRTYHTQHICTYSLYSDLQASTIRPFFQLLVDAALNKDVIIGSKYDIIQHNINYTSPDTVQHIDKLEYELISNSHIN